MKRYGIVVAVAGLLAVSAMAQTKPEPLDGYGEFIGGLYGPAAHWTNYPRWGYISGPKDGRIYGTEFGIAFDRPTEVTHVTYTSTTVDPGGINSRVLVQGFDVYANGVPVGTIEFDSSKNYFGAELTAPIRDANGNQIAVTANWLTLIPWLTVNQTSTLYSFSYLGMPATTGESEINHNLKSAGNVKNVTPSAGAYYSNLDCVVDGKLLSEVNGNSIFWINGPGQASLTIDYVTAVDVRSVGIALFANEGNRVAPQWVEIFGYLSSDSAAEDYDYYMKIPLDKLLTYYNRYDLRDEDGELTVFHDVMSLKIQFPAPDDPTAPWWGTDRVYGLTEFQAFAEYVPDCPPPQIIPEPATMTLLALGGLAMLRRRK